MGLSDGKSLAKLVLIDCGKAISEPIFRSFSLTCNGSAFDGARAPNDRETDNQILWTDEAASTCGHRGVGLVLFARYSIIDQEVPVAYIDVFNGDADGLCALHQLRLAEPVESTLITGVKRDISLLKRVQAGEEDDITVLDISLDKNREDLVRLLERGARVHYFDHHYPGEVPQYENLSTSIDPSPEVCTALLVDSFLNSQYRPWAVTAAFGDNLDSRAHQAAQPLGLGEPQLMQLRELGIYLNYNAYGASVEDLYFPPDQLFKRLKPYQNPFDFIAEAETFLRLREGYAQDMLQTNATKPELEQDNCALFILPAQAWARRVSGVFGNKLAQQFPNRAHAILTALPDGGYVVSVRAPLTNKTGADELCRAFPTGGGRKAAAGINNLPEALFDEFVTKFKAKYT
jgi:hypothetical protein